MTSKRLSLAGKAACVIGFTCLAFASYAADSDFETFAREQRAGVQQSKNDFEAYKDELKKEFELYKNAYDRALEKQRKRVTPRWGEYREGGKEVWVSYERDDSIRRSVNFRTGEVELETVIPRGEKQEQAVQLLRAQILDLFRETENSVYNKDDIAQAVEKELAGNKKVVTGKPTTRPAMQALMPELDNTNSAPDLARKAEQNAAIDTRKSALPDKEVVRLKFTLPRTAPEKSRLYDGIVGKVSRKEDVPPAIIFAVMETESNFNPLAKSHIPAYGLMQIVPRSAGLDATNYLYGEGRLLSPSFLYNSDNNIVIGSAYLHVLYHQYLGKIENPVSRLYCTVAAYNTGAGNVAKAFGHGTNIKRATQSINQLSPKQVYATLLKKLPHAETRRYLKDVSLRLEKYQ
ncbi:MAG: transglycosylase SLT domain-containing protein [Gammaproteobacteria bacterium]|nr:transglycosylase SLT domain-containing protein [Gammaproteobacteria bacterium]